jgi:hypothetical protein
MPQFGYLTRRQMDPRPGRNYATEYYKQSASERARTQKFVETTILKVGELALTCPDGVHTLTQPMRGFQRRETRGAYSAYDVMNDMFEQMRSGKDIPSGMLGRWNRLMEPHGLAIEMVRETELPPSNNFDQLMTQDPDRDQS